MTWTGNPRTTTPHWRQLRATVLATSTRCHICGNDGADQVDHLSSWATETKAGRNPDRLDNLAPIHAHPCHATKSSREGAHARWRTRATRQPEAHPGLR